MADQPSAPLSDLAAVIAALHAAVHGLLVEVASQNGERALDRVRSTAEREIEKENLNEFQYDKVMRALEGIFSGEMRRH